MVFTVLDPRIIIRNKICSTFDIDDDGENEYYILVGTVKVPIYLGEESKSQTIPNMPFIIFDLLSSLSEPQDICAATRKQECIIDVTIYFAQIDDINIVTFGKSICDTFVNLIRTYQSTTNGIHFMNVRNEGRVIPEMKGRQVIFHRNMELYTIFYDNIP